MLIIFRKFLFAGSICLLLLSSCSSLKPVNKKFEPGTKPISSLGEIAGDYEIFATENCTRTLEFAFTFSDKFNYKNPPKNDDRINLAVVDNSRLRATVYKDGKIIKSKIIKGSFTGGKFTFRLRKLKTVRPVYGLINGFVTQKSSISLTTGGDLVLDSTTSGLLLLVILPTFGAGDEFDSKIFRRKN